MADRTKVLSVHFLRRVARHRERDIQAFLRHGGAFGEPWRDDLPRWTRGVRVEKAGPFQWAVVATEHAGH